MATLNSSNIITGNIVESNDILQLYDAFTAGGGTTGAYDVSISGSLLGTSSFAISASYVETAQTASYTLTSSYVNPLTQTVTINGLLIQTGSHAEGGNTTANGGISHAEGSHTNAIGFASHAEGWGATSSGSYSHAEGLSTTATGNYSHAEGAYTSTLGTGSHAEGTSTTATGIASHAEGAYTSTLGTGSHAEGYGTIAKGDYSHAEGFHTVASGSYQHVQGQYNISSSAQSAFIVGNGTAEGARSNLIFASASLVQVTGSVISTAGFTGSLQGTASYAVTASHAVTASYAVTASHAVTASYTLNAGTTQWYSPTTNDYSTPSGRDVGILFKYVSTNPLIHLHTSSAQPGDQVIIIVSSSQNNNVTVNVESPAKIALGNADGTSITNGDTDSYWKYICVDETPTWRLVGYSDNDTITSGAWTTTLNP